MVLLSDFLRCFDLEHISCSDVLKRLNLYYVDYDDLKGSKFVPFEFVGFTRVFSDSPDVEFKFVYLLRPRAYLILTYSLMNFHLSLIPRVFFVVPSELGVIGLMILFCLFDYEKICSCIDFEVGRGDSHGHSWRPWC